MSLPACSRQMDLNYKYYFPELFRRAFCSGRSAARTSGMGRSRCLRGTSGVEVNSAEGRTSNFKSVWFLPTARKKFLHLSRTPVNTCPWGLCCEGERSWESWSQLWAVHGAGGLESWWAQREGGPQPSATCQNEGQRQVDVKLGTMVPTSVPSLLDLFTHEWSVKAEESVAWGGLRA